MTDLTKKQREVLVFVADYIKREMVGPSLREVAAEFGWASVAAAVTHIRALRKKGYVEEQRGQVRMLRPSPKGWAEVQPKEPA